MKHFILLFAAVLLPTFSTFAQIPDLAEAGDRFGNVLAMGDFNGDGFGDVAVGLPFESVRELNEAGAVNVLYGSKSGLTTDGAQVWHQDVEGMRESAGVDDHFGVALATGDFDGDGFDDLAIGIHQEDIPDPVLTGAIQITDAGAVQVLYGTANGLSAARNQVWTQDSEGLGSADEGETFGEALAAGDFDGDGFDDLAVGSPREEVFGQDGLGIVDVLYGSRDSLTARSHFLNPDAQGNHFGSVLTAGDFNCDGRSDVAVGEPIAEVGGNTFAGAVSVFYARSGGFGRFGTTDPQVWNQDSPGFKDAAEAGDQFGRSLTAGDFDGDGCDELAIGSRESFFPDISNGGAVQVLVGAPSGLTAAGSQFWFQDADDVEGTTEALESFGGSLAAGDFNGDTFEDLAVGVFGENLKDVTNAGAVQLFYGSSSGLTANDDEIWHRNVSGVVGEARSADIFGRSLAVGDFDGDGLLDLAVGITGDDLDVNTLRSTGAVHMFRGAKAGLTTEGNRLYRQATVIAVADEAITPEDTPVTFDVLTNDIVIPGHEVVLIRVEQPSSGGAEELDGGTVRYTPEQDVTGTVEFNYVARNTTTNDESTGRIAVRLLVVNDAPVITPADPFPTEAVSGLPFETSLQASDIDGDALSFSAPVLPGWLVLDDDGNGRATLRGTPAADNLGANAVTVRVTDGIVNTDATFTVTVVLGAPAASVLLQPADRAAGVELPVALVWQAADGAAAYDVQVSTVADFSATVIDSSGVTDTTLTAGGLAPVTTYFWRVRSRNTVGTSDFTPAFFFSTVSGVATENGGLPVRFELGPSYPNPFNRSTTITYTLAAPARVHLAVYDLHGRKVRRLVDTRQPAGRYAVAFEAGALASGMYLYRLDAGSFSSANHLILLK